MSEKLSADEARRAVMSPHAAPIWRIAHAIDGSGPAFAGGVAATKLADILMLGETENWPRSTRKRDEVEGLFQPLTVLPKDDGRMYRSFLPEDLEEGDAATLRSLAAQTKNPCVQARVYEVLWARFKHFPDAVAAVGARFDAAKLADAETDWPGLVKNLGRVTTLVLAINAKDRLTELVSALDDARAKLLACSRPFALTVLADMVCNTLLDRKNGRELFTPSRGAAWAKDLASVAAKYRADAHHGHDALVMLQAWQARWGEKQAAEATRRDVVVQLGEVADASDAKSAPWHRQRALQAALDYGVADLSHSTRHALMESVKASIPTFEKFSSSFELPPELVAVVDEAIARSSHPADAVRQLSLTAGLLEADLAQMRASAVEQARETPFLSFVPAVHIHPDGKITHRSEGGDGHPGRHVSFLVNGRLLLTEALLRHFLAQILGRFDENTLLKALAEWPHLPAHRKAMLARASERFHARDWISAGHLVATLYEAVLRDLLRRAGYHALKIERDGVQMDETLNSLLRGDAARSALGSGYCTMAELVLCDSELGWNLRNEIAHGTARPEHFSPARVLLVWLLLIRVTCFTVQPSTTNTSEPADGDEPDAPPSPTTVSPIPPADVAVDRGKSEEVR